jgi:hypothetical protein
MHAPLKAYVVKRGGIRMSAHWRLAYRLVDMAVEEWPGGCDIDRMADVLQARLSIRVRREYGSVVGRLLVCVLVPAIARLAVEWWCARDSHRVLMKGWTAKDA